VVRAHQRRDEQRVEHEPERDREVRVADDVEEVVRVRVQHEAHLAEHGHREGERELSGSVVARADPGAQVEERAEGGGDRDRRLERDLERREAVPLHEEVRARVRQRDLERDEARHRREERREDAPTPEERALAPPVDAGDGDEGADADRPRGEPVGDPALRRRRAVEAGHAGEHEDVRELQDPGGEERGPDEPRARVPERPRAGREPLDREGGEGGGDHHRLDRGVHREPQRLREDDPARPRYQR
jgi:hypothetical protein